MNEVRMEMTLADSQYDGGCNFCNRRPCDQNGVTPQYTVYVVERSPTGGMAPRFCEECLGDLVGHVARMVTSGTP